MEFDSEKFKDLVHYICHVANRDDLGATKLNKILWYSDIISYVNYGVPITGASYKKEQFGPVPKAILPALEALGNEGKMIIRDIPFYAKTKREYITLTEPDIGRFTAKEISLVSQLIHDICHHHTAGSISELTHDKVWELAEIGEEIPYHAVYAAPLGQVTEEYILWAKESITANDELYNRVV